MRVFYNHKKTFVILILIIIGASAFAYPGYKVIYKEQYYKLYHQQLYMYPENYAENIRWLESTLRADFANPLYAMTPITNDIEWKWYRNHFNLHTNLLLTQTYLQWANKYIKQNAYFYNAPWKEENLKSLEKAKKLIKMASVYWTESLKSKEDIDAMQLYFMNLEGIQHWEDEYVRIKNNELNYETIINRENTHIKTIEAEFESMDESTY